MPPAFPLVAASVLRDVGRLIMQVLFAFTLLLIAIWGQISQGNRALKMGQDIAFGSFALFVWFIGVSQMISGRVSGLALVVITILMGTALVDPLRARTWARILPIDPESRMHMLGLVCLLFAVAVFFLSSASIAQPINTQDQLNQIVPTGGIVFAVGEAIVVGALAFVLCGIGLRRTQKVAVARANPSRTAVAVGRGVIATSADEEEAKERYVGGVRFTWRRTPDALRARLGLAVPTPLTLLIAVVTAAALVGVTIGGERLTALLSPTIAENVDRINAQAQANIGGLGRAAVAAVLLGIGEELLFRGAIQPRYGIFLTALAFAALHTQYGFGVAPLTVFAIGLVLGIERRYTNTTASILSHVLFVIAMVSLVAAGVWMG